MIRILLVDDSAVARRWLSTALSFEHDIEIVGQGANGREAVEKVKELRPDLVIMDMAMPEMDGVAATKEIMNSCPTAIIMLSAMVNRPEGMETIQGVLQGALKVVEKPQSQSTLDEWKEQLLKTIRAIAASDVVKDLHLTQSLK